MPRQSTLCLCAMLCLFLAAQRSLAAPPKNELAPPSPSARQAEREAALVKMLSGATLEGTYTSTGPGSDRSKLSRDKYTLGNVRKLGGHLWLIEARIQYDRHDVTLPITVPIRWAGDTPVIVVDNLGVPPFGTVTARVMFFDGHYAGYWKHGDHGGHMFGVIKPGGEKPAPPAAAVNQPASSLDPSAGEQANQQRRQQ